jgi:CHAD domain-containing protein
MAKQKTDQSICVYGAGVLLKHRLALVQEVDGVRSGAEDIEFIHRMRVASRRLRSAFPLFETCLPAKRSLVWLTQIKKVTRALGAARDADVQLEALNTFFAQQNDKAYRPGLVRLQLRLTQRRRRLQEPLTKAMHNLQESQVLDDLEHHLAPLADLQDAMYLYTPALYQHSFNAINERLNDFLAYEAIVFQPEKKEELHAMRISAKWLRYTLENFSAIYSNALKPQLQIVRKVQELLGDIHDYDVWIDFLPAFLQEERQRILDFYGNERSYRRIVPGVQHFADDRQALREARYQEFTGEWQRWQQEYVWDELRKIIHAPALSTPPVQE